MRINRNNYEAFLLDLSEGNLSDELKHELDSFLALNPDLSTDLFDDFFSIKNESTAYIDKDLLKFDSITESNRKHFFTAFHERDLNLSDQNKVLNFISENPEFKVEFDQFSRLFLKSSNEIFKDKKTLHAIANSSKPKSIVYWSSRIAAILLIGFILNALFQNTVNVAPKYTFEDRLNIQPNIQQEETMDFTTFITNKNTEKNNTENHPVDKISSNQIIISQSAYVVKTERNNNDDHYNRRNEKKKTPVITKNPKLNEVIASFSIEKEESENVDLKTSPSKKVETPPSLLAYLGDKAKEKKLLTENGRPDILSFINKGSKTITGQEVIAHSKTEQSNSTVFKLGGLKIERISNK